MKTFWNNYKESVESFTLEGFNEGCEFLEVLSVDGWKYIWTTLFRNYIIKIATYEMKHISHFGGNSTSRMAGNHLKLRSWLQNSRLDLYSFNERLLPLWCDIFCQ